MAGSNSSDEPHFPVPDLASSPLEIQPKPSKSYTNVFCKSLISILVLVFIPLFPSQAPEFMHQSIITKFWELFHLMFIGIAVSYGLFSRRNVKTEIETHPRIGSPRSYLSKILQVSSIFEDGFENFCGSDEKIKVQAWYSQYSQGEPMGPFIDGSCVLEQVNTLRFPVCKNGFGNPYGSNGKKVTTLWSSQNFHGEFMVVIANGNDGLHQWGESVSCVDYRPLGLPVRRLRSRNAEADSSKCTRVEGLERIDVLNFCPETRKAVSDTSDSIVRSGSSSILRDGTKYDGAINKVKITGVGPTHSEEKYKKIASPSRIPWRSRLGRMKIREEVIDSKLPSHTRPFSVGQFEFENLKSRSFRCPKPSRTSSMSSSPNRPSPSVSVELPNPKNDLKEYSIQALHSPLLPRNGEASFISNDLGVGCDVHRSFKDDLKRDFSNSRRVDSLMDPLESKVQRSTLAKGLSRAKSVRTVRHSDQSVEAKETGQVYSNPIDDKVRTTCQQFKATSREISLRREAAGNENPSGNTQKQNVGNLSHVPNSTFWEFQNGEKQGTAESEMVETEEDSESECDNFQVSSDEDAGSEITNGAEHQTNEVDRKAGEFIAKFREQIRFQKNSSFTGFSDG